MGSQRQTCGLDLCKKGCVIKKKLICITSSHYSYFCKPRPTFPWSDLPCKDLDCLWGGMCFHGRSLRLSTSNNTEAEWLLGHGWRPSKWMSSNANIYLDFCKMIQHIENTIVILIMNFQSQPYQKALKSNIIETAQLYDISYCQYHLQCLAGRKQIPTFFALSTYKCITYNTSPMS